MTGKPDSNEQLTRKLRDRVAGLAGAEGAQRGRWRVIAAGSQAGMLAAILTELDETVLARRLEFRTDTGKTVTIAAANRRLYAISQAASAGDGIVGASEADDPGFVHVRAELEALVAGASELLVSAKRVRRAANAGDVGVSAEALARAWHLDIGARAPGPLPEKLAGFIGLCRQSATAEIGLNAGRIYLSAGDAAALDTLGTVAQAELAALPNEAVIPEGCLVLDYDSGPIVAVLGPTGPVAAFSVPTTAVAALRAAWFDAHAPAAAPA